jgi:hypothetical protein
MSRYRIVSDAGVDMGTYEAASPYAALDAAARDAGYASQADATERGVAAFAGTVTEVLT